MPLYSYGAATRPFHQTNNQSGDNVSIHSFIKRILLSGFLLAGASQAFAAVEVGGVRFDDTVSVGGQELKLNGAGVRTKVIFKVYAAALYLTERKTTAADVLALTGPRRLKLVLLRDVESDDFAKAFMDGLDANNDQAEKTKVAGQIGKIKEFFASIPKLRKGDTVVIDYLPGSGLQIFVNDKRVGEPLPDFAFANAFLRIWLGDKPADNSLKQRLLGGS
jgi:hypothetical protein